MNPAAMTERLIDAAIYNEEARGGYVAGARKELNEARGAIEAALGKPTFGEGSRELVLAALKQAASGGAAGLADHEIAEIADGLIAAIEGAKS
jgi:hypothetical protein